MDTRLSWLGAWSLGGSLVVVGCGADGDAEDSAPAGSTDGADGSGSAVTLEGEASASDGDDSGPADATGIADTSDGGTGAEDGSGDDGSTGGEGGPICDGVVECTGDTIWSRQIGNDDAPATNDTLSSVAVRPDGTVVIAGVAAGVIEFGAAGSVSGPGTGYVAQLGVDGEFDWVRGLEAGMTNLQFDITLERVGLDASGDVFVAGFSSGDVDLGDALVDGDSASWDVLLVSFDAQGTTRFAYNYGSYGEDDRAADLDVSAAGDIALVGSFYGGIEFGGNQLYATGGADAFVAVLDNEGAHVWSRRFGDASHQLGLATAFTGAGDVAVAARNFGTIDFGGQPMTTTTHNAIAIARLGADDGEPVWARQFEAQADGDLGEAALDADDDAIWLATFDGGSGQTVDFGQGPVDGDFFFAMLAAEADGATQWARGFGGARGITGVTRDRGDSVTIVGTLEGAVDFGSGPVSAVRGDVYTGWDAFVAKYDVTDGDLRWARVVGDYDQQPGLQRANGVGVDDDGFVYVGGTFSGSMNWGDHELVADGGFGGQNGFLVKLQP